MASIPFDYTNQAQLAKDIASGSPSYSYIIIIKKDCGSMLTGMAAFLI